MEADVPGAHRIGLYRLAPHQVRVAEHTFPVLEPERIMVPEHEDALDLPPVRSAVVRENPVPGIRNGLEFAEKSGVGHVTRDHNGVNAAVAVVFERPFESGGVVAGLKGFPSRSEPHMHIAHHPEPQKRPAASGERQRTASGKPRRREKSTEKISPCRIHVNGNSFSSPLIL